MIFVRDKTNYIPKEAGLSKMVVQTTDMTKLQNRTDKSVRYLAFLEAKKGSGKELMDILLTLVEPTRKEEGNIAYIPHYSLDNPDEIMFDEIWVDREAIDNHFKQPHMKDLSTRIEYLLAKPVELKAYSEVKVD
jgi:quinol monooxygenase YgiN